MVSDLLKKCVHDALLRLSIVGGDIHLERPADLSHGDYATNAALVHGGEAGENPRELAENIVAHIRAALPREVAAVDVADPGFINFFLSQDFFAERVKTIIQHPETWGSTDIRKGEKVMVEYTDPNPFKEFHIGHLMSNAIGESTSRIIEFSGAEVARANYQGDVGLHVAKAVWGLQKSGVEPSSLSGEAGIEMLGKAYARGAWAHEEDDDAKAEINAINRSIYARDSERTNTLYDTGRALSLSYFETMYEKLGTHFDHYFFESQSGVFGKQVVQEHANVFEKSDGAVVFRGDRHGLHTRVFLTSEGLPTYEAKELGLAQLKYDTYPYDLSVVVTGNEVHEYFKVVLKVMELVFPDLAEKTRHVPHGMMRLPSGKMSSRTGDIITAESLIRDVGARALQKIEDSGVSGKERERIAEQVAIGAIKYSILKQAAGHDIIFDTEEALSFEGDSGPYLQYAHARARSVLERAGGASAAAPAPPPRDWHTTLVERLLCQFPEVVERAESECEPHHITTYLTKLAGAFNHWYAKEKILDGSPEEPYKLALTKAVAVALKNGLHLLGIPAPEHM